ncbi:glutamyl-tRNA reductase [Clostridium sp. SY8519]|uniref:glutamyl-tRNA reductase n=1 Tax=Clostridium sp. (strain SY8519) TaxID=1042156 RepID=UPI00021719D8|nr:glutamyl-tRNA reductase [Clostridium sp. SY8519]BAK47470.1 glutamyl-tRNA reductase [Clostridium sp. SY8519]
MFVLSINYRIAGAEERQKFSLQEAEKERLYAGLKERGICQAVYLFTCNRCELYGIGRFYEALQVLAEVCGTDPSEMKEQVLVYEGRRAMVHLFRVISGMDSMVVGEDEILGQMRQAYLYAKDRGAAAYELNTIFQAALAGAKKVKTDTLLSKSSVSVATLAAAKCHEWKEGKKRVLMIGAGGDIGGKTMLNLLSYGDCEIQATYRRRRFRQQGVSMLPYEDRIAAVRGADIVISATASPHYTLVYKELKQAGLPEKQRLFVDLAVPRDIDDEVRRLPGAELIRIDDFQQIARENNARKESAVQSAEEILREQLDELEKELEFHRFFPRFQKMRQERGGEFARLVFQYRKAATAEEFDSFIRVLERLESRE